MKSILSVLSVITLLLFLTRACCADESRSNGVFSDAGFEISSDFNFASNYVWRGIMLDGDPVAQPGIYIKTPESKSGRIKFGYWESYDLKNADALHSGENDYILDYTGSFHDLDLSVGHIYYDFPDAIPADGAAKGFSREVYAGMGVPGLFLSPSIFFYYDYGRKEDGGGEGSYTVLNLFKSIPFSLSKYSLSLDLSGHLAHNNKQYYRGKGGDAALGAGVTIPLTKNLSVKPNINYSLPWGNISDKGNGNQKNKVYGGGYLCCVF
jgi:hypothetical protein